MTSRTRTELACLKSARTTLIARPVPHYAHEQAEVVGESWWWSALNVLMGVACWVAVVLFFVIIGA